MNHSLLLHVTRDGHVPTSVSLQPVSRLFAGSGANCGLHLDAVAVAPIHLMVSTDENLNVRVQDWNTDGGTMLNGSPVEGEADLHIGDELQVGPYRITATANNVDSERDPLPEVKITAVNELDQPQTEPKSPAMQLGDSTAELETEGADQDQHASESTLTSKFEYSLDLADDDWRHETDDECRLPGPDDRVATGQLESLQAEIDQLYSELAQRDAYIQELEFSPDTNLESPDVSEEDTMRLVNRLEELLDELQSSDSRVQELEELLRLSDEATRAEQQERKQLESWVLEIEQRVAQREDLSAAELNRMEQKYADLKNDNATIQQQLEQSLRARQDSEGEAGQQLILQLREQVEELQQRLSIAAQDHQEFRDQKQQDESAIRKELQALEQSYLELQVETSQERAKLARDREQLQRAQDQLEKKLNVETADNADTRIRAMRQRLRDEQSQEQEIKQQRSLSGRIAKLLSLS